jgi:hypothetical protein
MIIKYKIKYYPNILYVPDDTNNIHLVFIELPHDFYLYILF